MKKVLLLGDSIRISYQEEVARLLEGEAEVLWPAVNCRFSKFLLWGMHKWLADLGNPELDVVHWNAGIWDLHRVTVDGEVFTPPDEYARYIERLYIQMKYTAKKQIWATITPCGRSYSKMLKWADPTLVGDEMKPLSPEECLRDVEEYNRIATEILRQKGDVEFNDLYGLILSNRDEYISEDGIHLSPLGAQLAAKQAAECIRKLL
jgi:hypothetical protein